MMQTLSLLSNGVDFNFYIWIMSLVVWFCSLLNKPGRQGFIEPFNMCNFSPALVSKLSGNLMIFFLFLRISDICGVLTPYSANKLVPSSRFFNRKIIHLLSFIERTDRLRFKDMMIVNKHSWHCVACSSTGGPGSSCEKIIFRNNSHGEIFRVLSQAAQAPAVRRSSCEIAVMSKLDTRSFVCLFFAIARRTPRVGTGKNNKALSWEHMENVWSVF